MKILYVLDSGLKVAADYRSEYQMGAIEQQIFGLAKELLAKGHTVFIIRRWDNSKEMEKIDGVNFVNIDVPFTQRNFQESLSLTKVPIVFAESLLFSVKAYRKIREINPDIVNTSTLLTGYFISQLRMPISRKVFITHDYDVISFQTVFSGFKRKMLKSIMTNSDKVVTLNEGMRNYLNAWGFRADAIIPNALNLKDYKNKGDESFILYAGRLVPHKRVEDLIKAYSDISKDFNENLTIIGSGPCKEKLKSYATSLGLEEKVSFIPFLPRSKYRDYLSRCSIFVLPSSAEAFGVVIIEAMASGKPVIARNIIGPKDIINHGYNGFLFNDTKELAEYLKLLLSDEELRKKLGENARDTIEEKYTFSKVAKEYLKLYESLIVHNH